jgi:hypothetical protein
MGAVDGDEVQLDPALGPGQPSLHQLRVVVPGIVQISSSKSGGSAKVGASPMVRKLIHHMNEAVVLPFGWFEGGLRGLSGSS